MSGPNYHKTKWFSENLVALEINKTKVIINMSFYTWLSILDISKIAM